MMDLVHVEHVSAPNDDARLTLLLKARAHAAENCVQANTQAMGIKADLVEHLRRRLQAGHDRSALRRALLDAGVTVSVTADLLTHAGGKPQPAYRTDRRQQSLPYA